MFEIKLRPSQPRMQRGSGLRRTRGRFVHGFKPGLNLFQRLRKFFGVVDDVQEKTPYVERRPAKFAKLGGAWRAALLKGRSLNGGGDIVSLQLVRHFLVATTRTKQLGSDSFWVTVSLPAVFIS